MSNGEDILASGEPRQPEEDKRIRTMQEDMARASEHALPDIPLPTPSEQDVPSFTAPSRGLTPAPPPEPPSSTTGAPMGLPIVSQDIDLLGEPENEPQPTPTTPSITSPMIEPTPISPPPPPQEPQPSANMPPEIPVLNPEERLSYGEEQPGASMIEPSPAAQEVRGAAPVLRPEELLSFGDEALPEAKHSALSGITARLPVKFIAIAGLGILLLGGAGTAGYIFLFKKSTPSPVTQTPPPTIPPTTIGTKCPEPQIPQPLIKVADTKQFSAASLDEVGKTLQKAITAPDVQNDKLVRAVIKLEATADCRLLSLDEVLAGFKVILPKNVSESLDASQFLMLLWREHDAMRVGFVVGVKNSDTLRGDMRAWEPNMAQDLDAFLSELGKTTGPSTPAFNETPHAGLTVRYLNFPLPDLTTDYTVDAERKLFLLTTSRASMFATIDARP